eukprot:1156951-Pelagomonas_calceolata.AAC.7
MMLFDKDGLIKHYATPEQVLEEFYELRLHYYELRRQALLKVRGECSPLVLLLAWACLIGAEEKRFRMNKCPVHAAEAELLRISNRVRFIKAVISGSLRVNNRKRAEVEADLEAQQFDRLPSKAKVHAWCPSQAFCLHGPVLPELISQTWLLYGLWSACAHHLARPGQASQASWGLRCFALHYPGWGGFCNRVSAIEPSRCCLYPYASDATANTTDVWVARLHTWAAKAAVAEEQNEEDGESSRAAHASYDYLLSMAIYSLTWEKVQALEEEADMQVWPAGGNRQGRESAGIGKPWIAKREFVGMQV